MNKEDFFEVLGELDDNIIKKAASTKHTHKAAWKICGAIAACLILASTALLHLFPTSHPGNKIATNDTPHHGITNHNITNQDAADDMAKDEVTESCAGDIAPMVYVNDTLYMQSGDQQGYPDWKDEFIYLGKIESMTSSETTPTENFQANDPIIGCKVYQYGENLVIYMNDAYWLYTKYDAPELP